MKPANCGAWRVGQVTKVHVATSAKVTRCLAPGAAAAAAARAGRRMGTQPTPSASRAAGCFWMEVTRGPHAGVTHKFCRWRHLNGDDNSAVSSDGSASRPLVRVLSIGRKKKCWLRLNEDLEVSTLHAELRLVSQDTDAEAQMQLMLRDTKSTNGSKVNGQALAASMDWPLVDGDLVGVGRTSMRFRRVVHGPVCDENGSEASVPSTTAAISAPQATPESSTAHVQASGSPATSSEPSAAAARAVEPATDAPNPRKVHDTAQTVSCMVCGCGLELLDLLEQQLHINACLGRAADADTPTVAASTAPAPTGRAKASKKRKRPASGGQAKPKAAKAPAKPPVSKEEHTDAQLALVALKISQLDAQMAKLVKKRATLVKSLDRLEKTKDKLRKTQVLPPGQVRGLLNLPAALRVIFPRVRQMSEKSSRESEFRAARTMPTVAQRYAPSRCGEACGAPRETLADVSMWARASQQLFGRPCETLLYRNRILRSYPPESSEDDAGSTTTGQEALLGAPETPEAAVPEVVKRVFPGWRRDLAFLAQQSAHELEMAREALLEAQASELQEPETETTEDLELTEVQEASEQQEAAMAALAAATDAARSEEEEEVAQPEAEDAATGESELLAGCEASQTGPSRPASRADQQRACEYMVQVMTRLIAHKRSQEGEDDETKREDEDEDVAMAQADQQTASEQSLSTVTAPQPSAEVEAGGGEAPARPAEPPPRLEAP